ncbi:uncharacterized protein LOC144658174 [Oculina patagonica]
MESFSLEGLFVYITETFTAGVIQSYQGQGFLENDPLIQRQDPLEDFKKFDNNDTIFQEYDPPPRDDSKMGWKRSRPEKWWMSLGKAMKCVFCIQILAGLAVGSLAILVLVLDFNSIDLCYETFHGNHGGLIHWNSTSHEIQAIIATGNAVEGFVVLMLPFLLITTMFGWPLVRKLNLLFFNPLVALLDTCYLVCLQAFGYHPSWTNYPSDVLFLFLLIINSVLVGREIANNNETERSRKLRKTIKVSAILAAQLAFVLPIAFGLSYGLIPFIGLRSETDRAVIAGALPLITAIPKVIVRLAGQRINFIHPGDAHVLLSVLYTASAIVFRIMQAELTSLQLYILLSFAHGAVDLLERLTIVMRDYLWYLIYKKLKRDTDAEAMLSAGKFRTPRSMRLIADMSIQMILGESTALIATTGFFQLYNFMYPTETLLSKNSIYFINHFFIRVFIALSIDFFFNSFSFWLQMSYLNIAVVRVWKKKWRKHMVVAFIVTTVTISFFASYLFAVVRDKRSGQVRHYFNCTRPFTRF